MNMSQDTGRAIAGVGLIAVGGMFLFAQVTGINFLGVAWPLLVLIPGLVFLVIALRSDNEETAGLIFPGIVVTGTGVILSYQNMTNHWESWAYIWTLYPVFVGMAMRFVGYRTQNPEVARVGKVMMLVGTTAFVGLAALFELFIFNGGSIGIIAPLIPVVMIGAGVFLLVRGANTSGKAKRKIHEV